MSKASILLGIVGAVIFLGSFWWLIYQLVVQKAVFLADRTLQNIVLGISSTVFLIVNFLSTTETSTQIWFNDWLTAHPTVRPFVSGIQLVAFVLALFCVLVRTYPSKIEQQMKPSRLSRLFVGLLVCLVIGLLALIYFQ